MPSDTIPGTPLATITTAALLSIEFPPEAPEGAYLYAYRLAGIVRRVAATEGRLGPILRLQGEFIAARDGATYGARSLIAPAAIVAAVRLAFAEGPEPTRDRRVTVHLDFDVWAIRRAAAPLGYELQCDGRAYVPEPLSALIAAALSRPVPTQPEEA